MNTRQQLETVIQEHSHIIRCYQEAMRNLGRTEPEYRRLRANLERARERRRALADKLKSAKLDAG